MHKTLSNGYTRAFGRTRQFAGNKEFSQMVWSVCDQFMVSGLNFIIGIAAAKLLGIAAFGQLTLIMILAALAMVLHHTALTAPTMTLAGGRTKRSASYYAAVLFTGYGMSVLLAMIVAGVIAFVYGLRDGAVPVLLVVSAFAITLFQTNHNAVRRILFAQARGRSAFILDITRYVSLAGAVVVLWSASIPIDAAMLLMLFAGSAALSALAFNVSLLRAKIRRRLIVQMWARHWPIARWLVFMVVVSMGQEQIVWLIMGVVLGDEAVGGMRAGQHLLGITHFLLMAMENFIPRQAAGHFVKGGHLALRTYLLRQTVLIGSATLALVLALAVPAKFWMGTVYGADYLPYVSVLWIYAASYLAIFMRDLWVFYLRAIEKTETIFHAFAFSSVLALLAAYPAMKYGGVLGAASVVLAAHVISMVYVLVDVRRHYIKGMAGTQI